jgi:hypothetical protein
VAVKAHSLRACVESLLSNAQACGRRDLTGAQCCGGVTACGDGTIDLWSCRRNLPRAAATERLERARALTPVSFSSSPASPSSSFSSCVPGHRALPSWISSPRSTSPSVLSRVPPGYPSCRWAQHELSILAGLPRNFWDASFRAHTCRRSTRTP